MVSVFYHLATNVTNFIKNVSASDEFDLVRGTQQLRYNVDLLMHYFTYYIEVVVHEKL